MDEKEQFEAEKADLLDMFGHPGWRALMRQTQAQLDEFRKGMPFNIQNTEQLFFAKGVAATLTDLLNTELKLTFTMPEAEPEE